MIDYFNKSFSINKVFLNWRNASFFMQVLSLIYLFFLAYIYSYFDKYFDFTDSSYYWLSAKYADSFFGVSQFGHYTGLIYTLTFENLFVQRVVGAVLLLGCSFYLVYYLERIFNQVVQSDVSVGICSVWLMTSFSLFYYGKYFLVGLGYNWLAFLGVIIFLGGLFSLLDKEPLYDCLVYKYLYIALGGWLAWNAKPTTAIALVFIFIIFLLIHLKNKEIQTLRLLKWGCGYVFAFLCLHILFFEQGVGPYISEYTDGLKAMDLLGGHNETIKKKLLEFWAQYKSIFNNVFSKKQVMAVMVAIIFLKMTFWMIFYSKASLVQWQKYVAWGSTLLLLIAFFLLGQGHGLGINKLALTTIYFYTVMLCLSIINLDIEVVVYQKRDNLLEFLSQKMYLFSISVLLLLAPFAIVIGTGNIYSDHMYQFSGFILLAIYILFRSNLFFKRISNIFVIFTLFIGVVSVNKVMKAPYRMPESVFTETYQTKFLTDYNYLRLNKRAYVYIKSLQDLALQNNWMIGNSLIDLTGGTPGAALILGARVFSTPWLIGGYKGSNDFVTFALRKYPVKELINSWVLSTPDGSRRIDEGVLTKLGLDFPENYIKVGEVVFDYHRKEVHFLWKPNKPALISNKVAFKNED